MFLFGWTLHFETSLAGPEVALFLIGFGVSTAFNLTNTLLIDLHRDRPATATAAVNFVRCLMSAAGAAAIIPMCEAMGIGWAFTFWGVLFVGLVGAVFWVMGNGLRWRREGEERRRREREVEVAQGGMREVERRGLGDGVLKDKEEDKKSSASDVDCRSMEEGRGSERIHVAGKH